ncbi:hypothetical protein V5E97_00650 [Singulisphaera sp. Ch08]|uniref:WD40 repeat domain-containing protein n=1 Tax=Singulisphaera sp. Ch08 TaxID=3120278 RepID=A0AAU7CHA7_9BACT
MLKIISVGAASLAVACVGLTTSWALQPGVGLEVAVPQEAGSAARKGDLAGASKDDFPFVSEERFKDYRHATIGKMYPLIEGKQSPNFQSREAVLYQDGTVKLWSNRQKDPVAPPLRHDDPIKELMFIDELSLLITASNESIKVWDGLQGQLRKELSGETIHPHWLAAVPEVKQFVSIDTNHKAITIWDAVSLTRVTTLRLKGEADRVDAAGLSGDGKTVVAFRFGEDPSAMLWDVASGQPFATLRAPSSAITNLFNEKGTDLNPPQAKRGTRFWEVVRSLAPTTGQ